MESMFLYITLTLSTIVMVSGLTCTPGEARLVHGTTSMEGLVEICNNKSDWSTVCSNWFGCEESSVVCRQTGHDVAYSWYGNYTGLNARPEYGIYDCSGLESSLLDCPHFTQVYHYFDNDAYCGQTRVIGVKCGKLSTIEPDCDTEYAVRLVSGPKESEGQLQMCKNQRWRDVCGSNSYYKNIGITACRQLGYTSKWISASRNRYYYNSSVQPQLYTTLNCYSNRFSSVSSCSSSDCVNCSRYELAVQCELEKTDCVNGSLRLTGYIAEGWLEICIDGVWGRISHKVEGKTVEFACAALGFSKIGASVISHYSAARTYETSNSPVLVKYINCCDHDKVFGDCDFEYVTADETVPENYLALRCTDSCSYGQMRLTGAQSDDEGVVELCVNGIWTHVGLNQWDDFDANIVCQNLYPGKLYASASAMNSSDYERSNRRVYYDNVNCHNGATSIVQCSKYSASSAYTGPVAAVYCSPCCSCEQQKRSAESEIGNFVQGKWNTPPEGK